MSIETIRLFICLFLAVLAFDAFIFPRIVNLLEYLHERKQRNPPHD